MFPAFSENSKSDSRCEPPLHSDKDWLSNSTYHEFLSIEEKTTIDTPTYTSDSPSQHSNEKKRAVSKEKSHKHKSHQSKKIRHKEIVKLLDKKIFLEDFPDLSQEEAFTQDRRRDKSIYKTGVISSRYICKYFPYSCPIIGMRKKILLNDIPKKDKLKAYARSRYFYKKHVNLCNAKPLYHYNKQMKLTNNDKSSRIVNLPSYDCQNTPEVGCNTIQSETLNTIAQYNRDVNENPRNIDSWLKLIDIQSKYISETANVKSKEKLKHFVCEKQFAIVKTALQKNPGNLTLILKQLAIGEELSQEDVPRLWNQLTFSHPDKVKIWALYLNYICRNSSQYTTSRVSQAFSKCFTTLTKIMSGKVLSHKPQPDCANELLDLFSIYCFWLRHCGLHERAIASWQAIIEFNCHRPDNRRLQSGVDLAEDPLILDFEKFWDSEMPRFGEPSSMGWKTWLQTGIKYRERSSFIQSIDERYAELESSVLKAGSSSSKEKMWCPIELLKEKFHWLPWTRPSEEANDVDDPDRIVLFDEIFPCLIDFSGVTQTKEEYDQIKCKLIILFLDFLGLKHRFVLRDFLISKECAWLFDLECNFPTSFECFKQLQLSLPENKSYDIIIQNILSQSLIVGNEFSNTSAWSIHQWSSYLSCLELSRINQESCSIKSFMKQGKTVLQRDSNRNDLTVWNAYAQLLLQRDALPESRKVLDTALTLFPLEPIEKWPLITSSSAVEAWKSLLEKLSLIHTFTEAEMGSADSDFTSSTVLSLFLYSASGGPYTSAILTAPVSAPQALKIRHSLAKQIDDYWTSLINHCKQNDFSVPSHFAIRLRVILRILVKLCAISSSLNFIYEGEKVLSHELTNFSHRFSKIENDSFINGCVHSGEFLLCRNDFVEHLCYVYANHCRITQQESLLALQALLLKHCSTEQLSRNPSILRYVFPMANNRKLIPLSTVMFFRNSIGHLLNTDQSFSVWYFLLELEERRLRLMDEVTGLQTNHNAVNSRLRSLYEQVLDSTMFSKASLNVRLIWWKRFLTFESKLYKESFSQNNETATIQQRDRLKSVFYRSVQQCPWAKSLYMSYLEELSECSSEIMDVLTEREIRIRAPPEEIELLLLSSNQT